MLIVAGVGSKPLNFKHVFVPFLVPDPGRDPGAEAGPDLAPTDPGPGLAQRVAPRAEAGLFTGCILAICFRLFTKSRRNFKKSLKFPGYP